jgi:hypothetical protein
MPRRRWNAVGAKPPTARGGAIVAKEELKPKREDMSMFFGRVRDYDLGAHSKLDDHLERLSVRRRTTFDTASLKWRIWRSAYMASWHHRWVHQQRPEYVLMAERFLATLDRLMSEMVSLRVDPDVFAMVAENASLPSWPSYKQEAAVGSETRSLLANLRATEDQVRSYLNRHFIEDSPSSNAADHFVRCFAETTAIAWRAAVSPKLERTRDRGDFVGILGVALDDFGYPRSGKQLNSDRWIYDRVGRYDIWK